MPRQRNIALELCVEKAAQFVPGNGTRQRSIADITHQAIYQYGAIQKPDELEAFLALAADLSPRMVVEIGTKQAGTFYALGQIASSDALLISIDKPCGSGGGGYSLRDEFRFAQRRLPGQTQRYIRGDSHDLRGNRYSTYSRLERHLDGRPIDLLFIDGDHSYQGVRQDFETYGQLTDEGSIIAFHDIVPNPHDPAIEVAEFWRSRIKPHYPTREFIQPESFFKLPIKAAGIGVVFR